MSPALVDSTASTFLCTTTLGFFRPRNRTVFSAGSLSDPGRPLWSHCKRCPAACFLLRTIAPHRNISAIAKGLNNNAAVFRGLQQNIDFSRLDGARFIDSNDIVDWRWCESCCRGSSQRRRTAVRRAPDSHSRHPRPYACRRQPDKSSDNIFLLIQRLDHSAR